jgi:hypothetical protein
MRTETDVTFTATLVDHPIRLDHPLVYTLGLNATPVRPLPKGWRLWFSGGDRTCPPPPPTRPGPCWVVWAPLWTAQSEASAGGAYGYPVPGLSARAQAKGLIDNNRSRCRGDTGVGTASVQ